MAAKQKDEILNQLDRLSDTQFNRLKQMLHSMLHEQEADKDKRKTEPQEEHQVLTSGPRNYGEYLLIPEGDRWEIIEGIPFQMSAAPSRSHQRVLRELTTIFNSYLKDSDCEMFPAPFTVRPLSEKVTKDHTDIKNVVEPDITIVCDPSKVDEYGCFGAPDLIVEILSPSTAAKDRKEKYHLYKISGVKEYWIVDPANRTVEVTDFRGPTVVYSDKDQVRVGLFSELVIDLQEVFN